MKKYTLIWLILLSLIHSLSAQDITISAEAPQKVYEGDYIVVKYTINIKMNDYRPELTFPPELKPMSDHPDVGRSRSTSSGFTIHKTYYSYNLYASQSGIYPLPPFTIDINGQSYTSEALTVEVVENDIVAPENLFLGAKLTRPDVSVNQMVRYTVKLYVTTSITGFNFEEIVPPAFDGFSVKQVMLPTPQLVRHTYNGPPVLNL